MHKLTKRLFFVLIIGIFINACSSDTPKEWVEEEGYRWKAVDVDQGWSFSEKTGFEELSPANSGIQFENTVTEQQVSRNRVLINGSGVAAGDINGDGLTDVYFANIDGPNELYLNQGDWKFKEITAEAGSGLAMQGKYSTGVAFADVDGDADLDLIATTLADGNALFLNDGEGNFTEKADPFPGSENNGSHSIAIADIEKDGDLDVYITNYKARSAKDIYPTKRMFDDIVKQEGDDFSIREQFKDHYVLEERGDFVLRFETGESDLLYINDGKGNFTKKDMNSGIFRDASGNTVGELKEWGLHAKFFDINEDGYQDLYVCNDFESPDRIWMNQKDGTFRAIENTAIRHTSLSSMSVDNADLNKDGSTDIFIAEMLARSQSDKLKHLGTMIPLPEPVGAIANRPQYVGNTLMLNRGDATFSNITDYAGLKSSNWTWGSIFADVDLDGHEDIIISNGNYYDSQDLDANNQLQQKIAAEQIDPTQVMLQYPSLEQTNIVFKNNGDLTFSDKSTDWGFKGQDISQGLATADFDNDGDLDLVMNRLNGKAGLFKNVSRADRIGIRLIGEGTNTQAIGSTIEVSGGNMVQSKEVSGGGTYLSSSDQIYSFAASDAPITVTITWYDGSVSTLDSLQANRMYEFSKSGLAVTAAEGDDSKRAAQNPVFADRSELLNHTHTDDLFNDFEEKQSLLPYRLSQSGPGISWADLNGDGFDELIIGTGKGGQVSLFENNGGNAFTERTMNGQLSSQNDYNSVLALNRGDKATVLMAPFNYETSSDSIPIDLAQMEGGLSTDVDSSIVLNREEAVGPMAAADYDKDGDLDLFIGGRFTPLKYPASSSSWLFVNEGGSYRYDGTNRLRSIGMVSGAVFSDINNDSWPDLILAREWNTPLVLINNEGTFTEATEDWGLGNYYGLWNGINTGDFNNDGKMDLVMTNAGKNNKYHRFVQDSGKEVRLFYYTYEIRPTSIIEAGYSNELRGWVPFRRLNKLGNEFALLRSRISSHEQYSKQTINNILGIGLENFRWVSANTFSSVVFFNEGDGFSPVELPLEAQLTRGFGVNVADFNADGSEDLFISQNFFAGTIEDTRADGGRGLLMLGDGAGGFKALSAASSGIEVYGEQRGSAVSDYNGDGKPDLVVTQNASKTKLFENNSTGSGITIRLHGSSHNPRAIGAKLRLLKGGSAVSYLREVKAGSGYLSQSSATQVMGYSDMPDAVSIVWPNGEEMEVSLPEGQSSVVIDRKGTVINQ